MWARRCRPGTYPLRAFSFDLSRATCRPGNLSPATSRPGFNGFVAGKNGKCCSVFLKNMDKNVEGPSDNVDIEILRVSHWIWGEEIESDQDQEYEGYPIDEDDVDGDDHVDAKDSMPKDSQSKGYEDRSSGT
ncbi:hypothetical protein Tco_1019588 [Tanacetum coccineum]|uniref:Uncharacterized protein n=1 Tax=Tanacetum coccineum TaxID=301880 RepID=A0ABQ5FZ23_9ASTR